MANGVKDGGTDQFRGRMTAARQWQMAGQTEEVLGGTAK
jgi:hypothetical protein